MINQVRLMEEKPLGEKIKAFLLKNMVTIMFIVICYIGFSLSGLTMAFFINDLITRVARNAFLILALIIPVMAGMGLNFAIVLGAMAGQVAIIAVTHWGIIGIKGFLICVALSAPIAILLGYLTGKLLNKTKGQEMITSLILGFFANGIYQFIFLILVGSVIPMNNETLVLSSGVGLRVSIDLTGGIKYAVDDLLKLPFYMGLLGIGLASVIAGLFYFLRIKKLAIPFEIKKAKIRAISYGISGILFLGWGYSVMISKSLMKGIRMPVVTMLCIAALCMFNVFISKTKIGQDSPGPQRPPGYRGT